MERTETWGDRVQSYSKKEEKLTSSFIEQRVSFEPVEVEDVVEDFRVPVEEELVALDDVVVTQVQLPAVVCVRRQMADPCLWIPGS